MSAAPGASPGARAMLEAAHVFYKVELDPEAAARAAMVAYIEADGASDMATRQEALDFFGDLIADGGIAFIDGRPGGLDLVLKALHELEQFTRELLERVIADVHEDEVHV